MKWVNKINDAAKQNFTIVGEAGEIILFNLYFMPSQQSWFFDFSYGDVVANGIRLCLAPNLIRAFKNVVPFGFCVVSTDGFDPNSVNDFTSGRVQLYTLNATDVQEIEEVLF